MPRSITPLALGVCFIFAMAFPALAQKTWTGAAADGGNWNGSGNWNPSGIPDATSDLIFDSAGAAVPTITILGTNAAADSLTFNSGTINYNLVSTSPILTGVTSITRGSASGGAAPTVNLAPISTGSLLFPTGSQLTITNNAPATSETSPTLVIGPNTIIGTTGSGGVIVGGTGTTTISGSFSASGHNVTGGLTKTGPGILTLSGTNNGLNGTVTVAGGTLRLDNTNNITGIKLGNGATGTTPSLALSGGELLVQGNATNSTLQSVVGSGITAINPGHNIVLISTNSGALQPVTLDLKSITRPALGATLDVDISQLGAVVQTTNTATSGMIGGWFTANGGATWATKAGGNVFPLVLYNSNAYASGNDTDVTADASVPANSSTYSLRFNNVTAHTVTLAGTLDIQSSGILVTPTSGGGTITGGTIVTNSPSELIVHAYKNLTINSALQLTGGLTKTGSDTLSLGGSLAAMTGPVNVNQGSLNFLNTSSVPTTSISLNDHSGTQQTLMYNFGASLDFSSPASIQLGANNAFYNQSQISRITFGGVISSTPGIATSIRLLSDNSGGGFNFYNSGNTFKGDINLNSGFLGFLDNNTLGDPANRLILSSGATNGGLQFGLSGVDLNHPVVLAGSSIISVGDTLSTTISGPISGPGGLFKNDGGTLTLAGNNTFAAGIQITDGTLRVSALPNLGNSPIVLIKRTGTLSITGTFASPASRSFALEAATSDGTATINVSTDQLFAIAGAVANNGGNGALLKTGAGTLALAGTANTYSGGTTVQQGTLFAASDGSLGGAAAPVTVNALGALAYIGTTTTARQFTLNNGTLSVASTQKLTLNGATVAGGFLSGPGTFTLTGNAMLGGVTATSSAVINQSGQATLFNFTNNGQYTNSAGQLVNWNNGTNTSAGRLIVNGTVSAVDFVSDGQINVSGGALLDNSFSSSSIVLGGGSRTTIDAGGTFAAGSTSIEVNGGLLVNNGKIFGITNVHFNGQAVGSGTYGTVNVFENGRFAPGASPSPAVFSPAVAAAAQASFATNTSLAVEIGGANAGTGYDRLAVSGSATLGGTLDITTANGFVPTSLEQFQIVTAGARSGVFTHYTGITAPNGLAYAPHYTGTDLTLIATIFGDANFDGKVDFADLVTVAQNYGKNVASTTDNWWAHGDFDLDGTVGFADLVKVAQHYGSALPADLPQLLEALNQVPEPSMIGILAMLITPTILRRRHQSKFKD